MWQINQVHPHVAYNAAVLTRENMPAETEVLRALELNPEKAKNVWLNIVADNVAVLGFSYKGKPLVYLVEKV